MHDILSLAGTNLLSPPVLFFALGFAASFARSDLEVPQAVAKALSLYLLLAIGFTGPRTKAIVDQLGVDLGPRGEVRVDKRFATSVPGVYCAGDSCRGASLIVWAIADGQEAARAIDQDLRGSTVPHLPTKGRDTPYGGR